MSFFIVVLWFVFAIVVGVAASSRNRSGFGWFVLSLFVSPILTTIWLMILPKLVTRRQLIEQHLSVRQCPSCAEMVKREAKVCRFCQRDLPEPEPIAQVALPRDWRLPTHAQPTDQSEERKPASGLGGVTVACGVALLLLLMIVVARAADATKVPWTPEQQQAEWQKADFQQSKD
jgi:hypothetical protein